MKLAYRFSIWPQRKQSALLLNEAQFREMIAEAKGMVLGNPECRGTFQVMLKNLNKMPEAAKTVASKKTAAKKVKGHKVNSMPSSCADTF